MIILSWNIQKITVEKAKEFSLNFGGVVNEIVGDEPFVLFVYENKTNPTGVLDALGTGIGAHQLIKKWTKLGGSSGVRENILIIAGNGASVDEPVLHMDWRIGFDLRCDAMHQAEKDAIRLRMATAHQRPLRASTTKGRAQQVEKVDKGTFRPARDFRCPAEIIVRDGDRRVKLLALHSPGPSAGSEHEEPFAHSYAESIFESAHGFDLVLGDFNLRTHDVRSSGFVDQGVQLGATTKGKEDGRHTYSRLDRIYSRPGFGIWSALVSDGQARDLTDHHCLAIRVEPREQKLITDYFAYLPSPIRQREVIYKNLGKAFDARKSFLKSGVSYEQCLAKRRKEAQERQAQRRMEILAAARQS